MWYTELEPRRQQQPSDEYSQTRAEGDGSQRTGYMKLKTLEVKSSDGYTKAFRSRSLEGESASG